MVSIGQPWIMSHFNQPNGTSGNGYESLYISVSPDGLEWTDFVTNSCLNFNPGLRDPSILLIGSTWFLVFSPGSTAVPSSSNNTSFPVFKSTDLQNWTQVTTVDCTAATNAAPQGTGGFKPAAWAPMFYRDPAGGQVYVFVMINTSTLYYTTPTDSTGLTTWSALTAVTVNNMPGAGTPYVYDTTIQKIGGTYHIFIVNGSLQLLVHGTASTVTGPWNIVQTCYQAAWGRGVPYLEGPTIVQIGPNRWRIYLDAPQTSWLGYHWSETSDQTLMDGWTPIKQCLRNGALNNAQLRHGQVISTTGM